MQNNKSHMRPKISELLGYFTRLYNSGASYRVPRKVPRKVPSVILCFLPPYLSILEHPQIIKYFKSVFNLMPAGILEITGLHFHLIMFLNFQNQERELDSFHYRTYHNERLCARDCLK